ncbi:MAG TPA: Lrp/AsnC family transcriptional regulator [Thermoanaerobaculia bacterium]|jgi:Lrp/AsnC family leucine-responsive transcriptional regulator|nr:Lrp/AsnC family transcriptional regulator [Thermoanaerobaculia bacterium]
MDCFDRRILEIVQRNNRLPAERIAAETGISASAVQRRLKRLRGDGTIVADVAVVSPEAAGRGVTAIVEVTIGERPLQRVLSEFRRLMLATDEVQQCYHVTGRGDFLLVVTARDMREYDALARRLFVDNPNVARFETSIVVNRIKAATFVPLEAGGEQKKRRENRAKA